MSETTLANLLSDLFPPKGRLLISLWDMIQFYNDDISDNLNLLDSFEKERAAANGQAECPAEQIDYLKRLLKVIRDDAKDWEMTGLFEKLDMLRGMLSMVPNNQDLAKQCHDLRGHFLHELRSVKVVRIRRGNLQYFEQDLLFGEAVGHAFPSVAEDLREAGNCIALELYTAAVFHLMRVVETGVKALSRRLRVQIKGGVEFADWGGMKRAISKKLDALTLKPRGKKKAEDLEFYRRVLAEFDGFAETRNGVMHSRVSCDEHTAIGNYRRVEEFMKRLATRISE